MKPSINEKCPCGSGIKYKKCCGLYHKGKIPKNGLELMKSRYSAYVYGDVHYIIKTTHKEHPDFTNDTIAWEKDIELFCQETHFIALHIMEFIEDKDQSFVTFKACLKQHGEDVSFIEKSRFVKLDGRWLYHSGVFL